jgi:hypothetical protein
VQTLNPAAKHAPGPIKTDQKYLNLAHIASTLKKKRSLWHHVINQNKKSKTYVLQFPC